MADLERFRRAPGLEWLVDRITSLPYKLVQLIDQMRKEILLGPLKRLRQNTARSVYCLQRQYLSDQRRVRLRGWQRSIHYLPGGSLFTDWEWMRELTLNSNILGHSESMYPRWLRDHAMLRRSGFVL